MRGFETALTLTLSHREKAFNKTTEDKIMKKLTLLSTTLLLISSQTVIANNPLPTGEQIAKNINARNEGISLSRNMQMILTDKRGKERFRETVSYRK